MGIQSSCIQLAFVALAVQWSCAQETGQRGDAGFDPVVANPAFAEGEGPRIVIDGGHGNYHTADGRFAAFAMLMQRDGYRVSGTEAAVDAEMLAEVDVFVISNAGAAPEWKLPTPSAFAAEEVAAIAAWVRGGGSLWLIADHMPMPGATEELAAAFGVIFHNGFATRADGALGQITFTSTRGLNMDHPIMRGRDDSEQVDSVVSFTGQAFRTVEPFEPLMTMPAGARILLPTVAWQFDEATPNISATGMMQGAASKFGAGRVAVFGEAAMFTSQVSGTGEQQRSTGFGHPAATHNQQFALNVMHWLTGLLDESE